MSSPVPSTGNGFCASSSCSCFSFSVSLGKPICSLVRLLLCKNTPLYFIGGVTIYFWCGNLNICCLFLWSEQAVIPRMLSVFSGRRRQWVGPAVSAWSLGSQQQQGPAGRWHRLLLVAGPWEVVISSRQIIKVTRAFGRSSSRVREFPGCESNNSLCSTAVPSEVTGTADGACSGTPIRRRP